MTGQVLGDGLDDLHLRQRMQVRLQGAESLTRRGVTGHGGHGDLRVSGEQAQDLSARIAGGS